MEVELSPGVVNSCNVARKRQAAQESGSETRLKIFPSIPQENRSKEIERPPKKRPCLEDCCWSLENACNVESENRSLSYTQPVVISHQRPDDNCSSSFYPDTATCNGHSHKDINCNLVNQENQFQEMDISYESTTTTRSRELHQQTFPVPSLLAQYDSSSASCLRCLRGEPGHINHLTI